MTRGMTKAAVAWLVSGLVILGLAGCTSGGDDAPAASASAPSSAPAPAGTVASTAVLTVDDPASPAELAVATAQAGRTELDIVPGSVVRVVGGQETTHGYALWGFQARGLVFEMILTPAGKGVSWAGCGQPVVVVDRCAGAAVAPSTLALAGRASPAVASVRVVTRSGERQPAVLGAGAWLYVTDDLPLKDEANGGVPASVEALDASGKVLREFPLS